MVLGPATNGRANRVIITHKPFFPVYLCLLLLVSLGNVCVSMVRSGWAKQFQPTCPFLPSNQIGVLKKFFLCEEEVMGGKCRTKTQTLSHHPPKSTLATESEEKVWHLDHENPQKGWRIFNVFAIDVNVWSWLRPDVSEEPN